MTKRIKYAGSSAGIPITPSQTLSENYGDVYPKYLDKDENGKLMLGAETVVPYDPGTGRAFMPVVIRNSTNSTTVSLGTVGGAANSFGLIGMNVNALLNYGSITSGAMEYARTPTKFVSATIPAATGTTDVWTPAAGKKFRLMGYMIHFSGTAAAAGLRTFSIQEETLGAIGMDTGTLAPAAGTGAENSVITVNLPGNGYLATTVDKKLQVVTGTTAYTAGVDYISVWGTEE